MHGIEVARHRGIKRMFSIDSADNRNMRELAKTLGFERKGGPDYPNEVVYSLALQ